LAQAILAQAVSGQFVVEFCGVNSLSLLDSERDW